MMPDRKFLTQIVPSHKILYQEKIALMLEAFHCPRNLTMLETIQDRRFQLK